MLNKTTTLYRPVGLAEYELIKNSGFLEFPPRLEWQPIFYPVLNQDYAGEIAQQWNTKDSFSGHIGIVTAFEFPHRTPARLMYKTLAEPCTMSFGYRLTN